MLHVLNRFSDFSYCRFRYLYAYDSFFLATHAQDSIPIIKILFSYEIIEMVVDYLLDVHHMSCRKKTFTNLDPSTMHLYARVMS